MRVEHRSARKAILEIGNEQMLTRVEKSGEREKGRAKKADPPIIIIIDDYCIRFNNGSSTRRNSSFLAFLLSLPLSLSGYLLFS